MEMALENLVGDFHENYLGNTTHMPSKTKWRKVPNGEIPGIDIANEKQNIYLQIKSKHNSMNSSSSGRLAEELATVALGKPNATVGCAWVVATSNRKAIGENRIAEVANVYKGKAAYGVVTGAQNELDTVMADLPRLIAQELKTEDIPGMLKSAVRRITDQLEKKAKSEGKTVIQFLMDKSID